MSELLTTYRPTRYMLQLDPNMANKTYCGKVRVDYEFTAETSEIKIQASRDFQWTSIRLINFYAVYLECPIYASVLCDDYNHDLESEILTLSLDTPLTPDNTQNGFYIELEFTGPIIIAGQTTGLFAVDENSITANMKDGNAHKVAPCYEGVAIKTWLTVIGGEGSQVETNLNSDGQEDFEGRVKKNFITDEEITIENLCINVSNFS
ncbi:Aminopeptidase N-like N-terminal domain-containing protein [Caenorhabditis elegans]|uniref:Aminopeptidase N-like N-terminal domain-containing protein n=1 Tax=Caenorhabditis elegans TaxID=6239 RepID=Q20521_CAEEL|nr:Aminopeptidase N-like N-terminal domain-containing protein [Caenorhabditis elegans]CAB01196.1 Aminopeptidase N-like N-terminal domain-containing protein [Caenorhabditis elegans]|eukprot:NP_506553.1 Uncharacterized protein CELE_F47B8.8 [Caenorhabditis elegans]